MAKEIVLSDGSLTQVSDEDFLYLLSWTWAKSSRGYVKTTVKGKEIRLHNIVFERMGLSGSPDHIDRNKLNNQRNNLREATKSQQEGNRSIQSNNKSGYKGVSWCKKRNNWRACIMLKGKRIDIGRFQTKEQAAIAYNIEAKKQFGEFAYLNEV